MLDVFPCVFLSKIICVTTSHSSGLMATTTFPVIDEMIWICAMPEFVHQDCVKLIGYGGVPNHFLFNWDSLHARLSSHYEAWIYKKRKQKRLQHTGNLFRKNLQLKDVC